MLVIEIDTPNNANLLFGPIQEQVRGKFHPARVHQEAAYSLLKDFPDGIPGQRIEFDEVRNVGAIVEPLQEPANATIKAKVEDFAKGKVAVAVNTKGSAIPEARREFTNAHAATWGYWMKRAVEAGHAKLVSGKFADSYPDARRSFFHTPSVDARDSKISQLQDAVSVLTALMMAGLPDHKRKEVEKALGR